MIWSIKVSSAGERAKKVTTKTKEQLFQEINAARKPGSTGRVNQNYPKVFKKSAAPQAQPLLSLKNRVLSLPLVIGMTGGIVGGVLGFSTAGVVSLAVFPALVFGIGYYYFATSDPKEY